MRNLLAALTTALLLISVPALAQQPTGGAKRAEASGKVFSEKEKEIIKGYFDKENPKKPGGQDTDAKGKGKGKGKTDDGESTIVEIVDDDDSGGGKSKKKGKGKAKSGVGNGKGMSKQMPSGLAKRDELPPGLAMQLERNGKLPPGLAKRDLPCDLDNLLPMRRGGLERLIVAAEPVLSLFLKDNFWS